MEEMDKNKVTSKETTRIEAFSDGVFAIAITLLILEIHVPVPEGNETLLQSLMHEWASFLALLIGFFTLLVCWINHHYMFSMIHKSNSVLSLLNGFKLLVVTITPFATALLAKNIETSWILSSASIYAFNFTLMGFAMTSIWLYASRNGFATTESAKKLRIINRYYIFATILSTTIWLVSYVSIILSLVLFCLMFINYIFPERMVALWSFRRYTKDMSADVSANAIKVN